MPYKRLPRIAKVAAGEQPYTLRIVWDHGGESLVDVSRLIGTYRVYTPLRYNPDLFCQVRVGEYGTDVVWTDEVDMSADTLWRLAQEQSGMTMSAEAFHQWRVRKGYTLDEAAAALGVSRRMVAYYEHGDHPIPRRVALATRGLDHLESAGSGASREARTRGRKGGRRPTLSSGQQQRAAAMARDG
jgi:hypothetical protein